MNYPIGYIRSNLYPAGGAPAPVYDCDPIVQLVTAPATDAIDIEDVKGHLRIAHDTEDAQIALYLGTAIALLDGRDGWLSSGMITQDWRVSVSKQDRFGRIFAPLKPAQEVLSMGYYDRDDAAQALALDDYRTIVTDDYAYVEPKTGNKWPSDISSRPDAIFVTWRIGYGDDAASVPNPIKLAISLLVGHFFEHREATTTLRDIKDAPITVQHLIANYKTGWAA